MANPNNSGDLNGLRKLLDRLAGVDPKCMPAVIAGQWYMLETIPVNGLRPILRLGEPSKKKSTACPNGTGQTDPLPDLAAG